MVTPITCVCVCVCVRTRASKKIFVFSSSQTNIPNHQALYELLGSLTVIQYHFNIFKQHCVLLHARCC